MEKPNLHDDHTGIDPKPISSKVSIRTFCQRLRSGFSSLRKLQPRLPNNPNRPLMISSFASNRTTKSRPTLADQSSFAGLSKIIRRIVIALTSGLIVASCSPSEDPGSLYVSSNTIGQYEVYRIESQHPIQYQSEIIGNYNETLPLLPGRYLILADCSSQEILIKYGRTEKLIAHTISFETPSAPRDTDLFSIQCERYAGTHSRQNLTGKYQLNLLSGSRELLVGMVPFRPDETILNSTAKPEVLTYQLSSLTVSHYEGIQPGTRYFVSPQNQLIAITQNQEFGRKQFLLPGDYRVEVNGTAMNATLHPLEEQEIRPAFILVETQHADLSLSPQIRGVPAYAELNESHHIELNQTYPVLPGIATISLSDSIETKQITLESDLLSKIEVRAIIVHSNCSPWDWTCIGREKVFVTIANDPYVTATGITDVPILFFNTEAWVSLQGSKDIKIKVKDNARTAHFYTGRLRVIPVPTYRHSYYTDLVRIEVESKNRIGQSLDLSLTEAEDFLLIEGHYDLGQYATSIIQDQERRQSQKSFAITRGGLTELTYQTYTTDRKVVQRFKDNPQVLVHQSQAPQSSLHQLVPIRIF